MNAVGAVTAQGQSTTVPQPRLVQAAHEFEAQLVKELLKPMTNVNSLDGEDADPESSGALADFATDALGQALSKQGGLGIATIIVHSFSRNGENSQSNSDEGTNGMLSPNIGAAGSSKVYDRR